MLSGGWTPALESNCFAGVYSDVPAYAGSFLGLYPSIAVGPGEPPTPVDPAANAIGLFDNTGADYKHPLRAATSSLAGWTFSCQFTASNSSYDGTGATPAASKQSALEILDNAGKVIAEIDMAFQPVTAAHDPSGVDPNFMQPMFYIGGDMASGTNITWDQTVKLFGATYAGCGPLGNTASNASNPLAGMPDTGSMLWDIAANDLSISLSGSQITYTFRNKSYTVNAVDSSANVTCPCAIEATSDGGNGDVDMLNPQFVGH